MSGVRGSRNRNVVLPPTLRPSDPDYGRELYRIPEAAAYLCISRDLIYRAVDAGAIGFRRTGLGRGEFLFAQRDLDAWRERHRQEAVEAPPRRFRPVAAGFVDRPPIALPKNRKFQ